MIFVFLLSFAILIIALKSIQEQENRLPLILSAILFNLSFIFFEQIYLETSLNRSFHFSDPSNYYEEIRHLSIDNFLAFISDEDYKSNQFYYAINWIYLQSIQNTTVLALALKLTNACMFFSAFILLTKEQESNFAIDSVILFHPYLTMTLIRNVRDAYIIFFLSAFIYTLQTKSISPILKFAFYLSTSFFMLTVRPFFTAIMISLLIKNGVINRSKSSLTLMIILFLTILASTLYLDLLNINARIFSAIFSTFNTHEGFDEERDQIVSELMAGTSADLSFWISTAKRIIVAVPVFLFTPNPINYSIKYYQEHIYGTWGIYTFVDNILIIFGSIVNYAIVFPILIKAAYNIRKAQIDHVITAVFMFSSYTVFQLGITDTRIKYTFLFFSLMSMRHIYSGLGVSIVGDKKYFLASFVLLIALTIK